MADYKELIRRAVQALPENNGAARRAVYEKARTALVGQLRALDPPLAARDITQHRLQLEDCIRLVEQEASEAVISGLKFNDSQPEPHSPRVSPHVSAPTSGVSPTPLRVNSTAGRGAAVHSDMASPGSAYGTAAARAGTGGQVVAKIGPASIEDIIAAEDAAIEAGEAEPIEAARPHVPQHREPDVKETLPPSPPHERSDRDAGRVLPSIVARAEAAKSNGQASRPFDASRRASAMEQRREAEVGSTLSQTPVYPGKTSTSTIALTSGNTAMSSVREVELEPVMEDEDSQVDAQTAIARAIATLEREARGEDDEKPNTKRANGTVAALASPPREGTGETDLAPRSAPVSEPFFAPETPRGRPNLEPVYRELSAPEGFDVGQSRGAVEAERGSGSAVTIFLLVFLILLVAAGALGFWAWREGYIDLNAMFGKSPAVVETTTGAANSALAPANKTTAGALAPVDNGSVKPKAGVGNTEPAPAPGAKTDARLGAQEQPTNVVPPTPPELSAQSGDAAKSEARLNGAPAGSAAPGGASNGNAVETAAAATGNQSLLLEASSDGTTGAVPFSGTVEWSQGTDELGQPTLVGKADIPARNLGVSVLIRKNSDPTLPASNLMEINFTVTDSFIGGAISGLPGVLLKNEELVQGTPLVGASARVVGNSFLFALSASPTDVTTNTDLLTTRKWMDLAIIYATGKRAIITLEKDDKAEALFTKVFADWAKTPAASSSSK